MSGFDMIPSGPVVLTARAEQAAAGGCGFRLSTFATDPYRFPRNPPAQPITCCAGAAKTSVHSKDDTLMCEAIADVAARGITGRHAGTIMIGNHSDTVPDGDRFDGLAGVVALERSKGLKCAVS